MTRRTFRSLGGKLFTWERPLRHADDPFARARTAGDSTWTYSYTSDVRIISNAADPSAFLPPTPYRPTVPPCEWCGAVAAERRDACARCGGPVTDTKGGR